MAATLPRGPAWPRVVVVAGGVTSADAGGASASGGPPEDVLRWEDGDLIFEDRPGIGIELDETKLETYRA